MWQPAAHFADEQNDFNVSRSDVHLAVDVDDPAGGDANEYGMWQATDEAAAHGEQAPLVMTEAVRNSLCHLEEVEIVPPGISPNNYCIFNRKFEKHVDFTPDFLDFPLKSRESWGNQEG